MLSAPAKAPDLPGETQWPVAQKRKYAQICDEKLQEFTSFYEDNMTWLSEYYETIFSMQQESVVSRMLKTPSARTAGKLLPERPHIRDVFSESRLLDGCQEDTSDTMFAKALTRTPSLATTAAVSARATTHLTTVPDSTMDHGKLDDLFQQCLNTVKKAARGSAATNESEGEPASPNAHANAVPTVSQLSPIPAAYPATLLTHPLSPLPGNTVFMLEGPSLSRMATSETVHEVSMTDDYRPLPTEAMDIDHTSSPPLTQMVAQLLTSQPATNPEPTTADRHSPAAAKKPRTSLAPTSPAIKFPALASVAAAQLSPSNTHKSRSSRKLSRDLLKRASIQARIAADPSGPTPEERHSPIESGVLLPSPVAVLANNRPVLTLTASSVVETSAFSLSVARPTSPLAPAKSAEPPPVNRVLTGTERLRKALEQLRPASQSASPVVPVGTSLPFAPVPFAALGSRAETPKPVSPPAVPSAPRQDSGTFVGLASIHVGNASLVTAVASPTQPLTQEAVMIKSPMATSSVLASPEVDHTVLRGPSSDAKYQSQEDLPSPPAPSVPAGTVATAAVLIDETVVTTTPVLHSPTPIARSPLAKSPVLGDPASLETPPRRVLSPSTDEFLTPTEGLLPPSIDGQLAATDPTTPPSQDLLNPRTPGTLASALSAPFAGGSYIVQKLLSAMKMTTAANQATPAPTAPGQREPPPTLHLPLTTSRLPTSSATRSQPGIAASATRPQGRSEVGLFMSTNASALGTTSSTSTRAVSVANGPGKFTTTSASGARIVSNPTGTKHRFPAHEPQSFRAKLNQIKSAASEPTPSTAHRAPLAKPAAPPSRLPITAGKVPESTVRSVFKSLNPKAAVVKSYAGPQTVPKPTAPYPFVSAKSSDAVPTKASHAYAPPAATSAVNSGHLGNQHPRHVSAAALTSVPAVSSLQSPATPQAAPRSSPTAMDIDTTPLADRAKQYTPTSFNRTKSAVITEYQDVVVPLRTSDQRSAGEDESGPDDSFVSSNSHVSYASLNNESVSSVEIAHSNPAHPPGPPLPTAHRSASTPPRATPAPDQSSPEFTTLLGANNELPEIPEEYSDDEDDYSYTSSPASSSSGAAGGRPPKKRIPAWATSPALRAALARQRDMNPDLIFGPIKPMEMEEIFQKRDRRYRIRSSSANWSGTDRLTVAEEVEYEKRMGFRR
ncbi:hypothetical protein IWQ60_000971 [Tieghemiomyces parasiticus]|uniref:Inner centromere protein ARK-binding domain-containing protein n=1 Tax=Tieghemiomyces parasiticus TaxID=78921 RepID=A0A9W8AHU9_9FUNG|nr:hypothetical protein IWQ60_000971 [Tieghemiomyces parasiticus]